MFVQALAAYADEYLADQLADEAFESKPVPYFLEIGPDGTFLNKTEHNQQVVRGKKTATIAAPLVIAKSPVSRVAGLHPLLAVDNIKYVLGPGAWTPPGDERNARERHDAFAALITRAAEETSHAGLQACRKFYGRPDQVEAARTAFLAAKTGSKVALSVGGPVIKDQSVRDFWRTHFRAAAGTRVSRAGQGECLISGRVGEIARTHDKINGLGNLKGRAEVSLMSFDSPSFESYGWDQCANSPVSPDRANAYVLALNDLLKFDSKHRRDFPGVGFVFWTKEKTDIDLMAVIDQPDAAEIERLLRFDPSADPDPNVFYMAGVAGNGGRMLIRCWVAETLSAVKGNLRGWFAGLQIADAFSGQSAQAPKFWELLRAIDREGKPPSDRVVALLRRAIEGQAQPLGSRMLAAALTRLRAARNKERHYAARLGLIRLCLNDLNLRNGGGTPMTERLDPGQRHPAYLSGRLLSAYESLQYSANKGEVGQTVADRYYTLASTFPELAFPKLEDLGQKHLRKLRRDNPGARVRIEREISSLHLEIEQACGFKFPAALDLEGQGRFALGYHHQRAHSMAQAIAQKNKALTSQTDMTTEERAQENA